MDRQTFLIPETRAALRWGIGFVVCAAFAGALLLFAEQREIAGAATQSKLEAETTMTLSGPNVVAKPKSTASGGQEVAFYTNGSASSSFDGAATNLSLRARGNDCQGEPQLKVYVDGALKETVDLTSSTFADYTLPLSSLSAGTHTLQISFGNNFSDPGVCDRNAYLDYYLLTFPEAPPPSSRVLVGAGDIARCSSSGDEATAKLLDGISGTVFTVGDNAYSSGTATEFSECYEPSWGRHKARTKPTPGNHEYYTEGASGYFGYFGSVAGDPNKGYYSYNRGGWHVVALNSMCSQVGGCGANSPMVSWLKRDLAANDDRACTIAYFHHSLFSSGARHGNTPKMRPTWDALYAAKAEVVVGGHEHNYERFAPQTPSGEADPERGIREFVVGTGGGEHYPFGTVQPNSQVRIGGTSGVLKLTLRPSSYEWEFVPVAGKTFTDSGTQSCH